MDGEHIRLFDHTPGQMADSGLFWLVEYMRRGVRNRVLYSARREDGSKDDLHKAVSFDTLGNPIFPPRPLLTSEEILGRIAGGEFAALIEPSWFEKKPVAHLETKFDGSCCIRFDLLANNDDVANEVKLLLDYCKGKIRPEHSSVERTRCFVGPPQYQTVQVVTVNRLRDNTGQDCGRPKNDTQRAVGLWLWDYVEQHHCSQKSAIQKFEDSGWFGRLRIENVEDSDLRFFYRRTKEAIEQAQVLPFTKKGTKSKRQVPGT
jgi:hypothetical protein